MRRRFNQKKKMSPVGTYASSKTDFRNKDTTSYVLFKAKASLIREAM